MTDTPSQMPDEIYAGPLGFDAPNNKGQYTDSETAYGGTTKYIRADLVHPRAASVPSDKERAEALEAIYSDCKMDSLTMGEAMVEYRDIIKQALTAPDQSGKCPMGDDCDLTIAYMKGVSDGKRDQSETIKALVESLEKAKESIVEAVRLSALYNGRTYNFKPCIDDIKQALALAEKGGK